MSKDKEIDDNSYMVLQIVIWILLFIGGFAYGIRMGDKHWTDWCTENGYAGYNKQTGKLILYDKDYVKEPPR